MDVALELLKAAGPWGVIAGGFVWVIVWMVRMSDRLERLDHNEHGRVPKVERDVKEVREDIAELKTDAAVAAANTGWIKDHLERALRRETPAS